LLPSTAMSGSLPLTWLCPCATVACHRASGRRLARTAVIREASSEFTSSRRCVLLTAAQVCTGGCYTAEVVVNVVDACCRWSSLLSRHRTMVYRGRCLRRWWVTRRSSARSLAFLIVSSTLCRVSAGMLYLLCKVLCVCLACVIAMIVMLCCVCRRAEQRCC
jgi:hypothetical protein